MSRRRRRLRRAVRSQPERRAETPEAVVSLAEHFKPHDDEAAAVRIAALLHCNRERASALHDIMSDERTLTTAES